jgi:purine-cytosine permease-like protein
MRGAVLGLTVYIFVLLVSTLTQAMGYPTITIVNHITSIAAFVIFGVVLSFIIKK